MFYCLSFVITKLLLLQEDWIYFLRKLKYLTINTPQGHLNCNLADRAFEISIYEQECGFEFLKQ